MRILVESDALSVVRGMDHCQGLSSVNWQCRGYVQSPLHLKITFDFFFFFSIWSLRKVNEAAHILCCLGPLTRFLLAWWATVSLFVFPSAWGPFRFI